MLKLKKERGALGRYWVAGRTVAPGTLLLCERPILTVPNLDDSLNSALDLMQSTKKAEDIEDTKSDDSSKPAPLFCWHCLRIVKVTTSHSTPLSDTTYESSGKSAGDSMRYCSDACLIAAKTEFDFVYPLCGGNTTVAMVSRMLYRFITSATLQTASSQPSTGCFKMPPNLVDRFNAEPSLFYKCLGIENGSEIVALLKSKTDSTEDSSPLDDLLSSMFDDTKDDDGSATICEDVVIEDCELDDMDTTDAMEAVQKVPTKMAATKPLQKTKTAAKRKSPKKGYSKRRSKAKGKRGSGGGKKRGKCKKSSKRKQLKSKAAATSSAMAVECSRTDELLMRAMDNLLSGCMLQWTPKDALRLNREFEQNLNLLITRMIPHFIQELKLEIIDSGDDDDDDDSADLCATTKKTAVERELRKLAKHLLSLVFYNAFGVRNTVTDTDFNYGLCLFVGASFFNHSCAPNCYYYFDDCSNCCQSPTTASSFSSGSSLSGNEVRICVRALTAIEKGTPLCFAIVSDLECVLTEERQSMIADNFAFECMCLRCDSDSLYFQNECLLSAQKTVESLAVDKCRALLKHARTLWKLGKVQQSFLFYKRLVTNEVLQKHLCNLSNVFELKSTAVLLEVCEKAWFAEDYQTGVHCSELGVSLAKQLTNDSYCMEQCYAKEFIFLFYMFLHASAHVVFDLMTTESTDDEKRDYEQRLKLKHREFVDTCMFLISPKFEDFRTWVGSSLLCVQPRLESIILSVKPLFAS